MSSRSPRLFLVETAALAAALTLGAGCARGPETLYGSSKGASLNGTGALAALLRRQGHEVRNAYRLTEELAGWADVIVRFAFIPGPPDRDEARWYAEWLEIESERRLVYVVRDYDAQLEYWNLVLQLLVGPSDGERRQEAESNRRRAKNWVAQLPDKADKPADPGSWFAVGPAVHPPATCQSLEGPWALDIDARRAALTLHEPLKADQKHVLLTGDGQVLVMEWSVASGSRVLAIANGSFLLNLPLVNPARRPLAQRVAGWIGDSPRRVAFVDGPSVVDGPQPPQTFFDLLERIASFRWVALHLGLFGLLACLARAPRLGRPRPDPPSDADRPAAHAEAVGALLERSRATETARNLLETYRRWRFPRAPQEASRPPGRRMKKPLALASWCARTGV